MAEKITPFTMTTFTPKWDELVPLPLIFDFKARIEFLTSLLISSNLYYQHFRQHPKIKGAIALYKSGKLNGSKVLNVGGKLVSSEEALKAGLSVWSEVSAISSLSLRYVLIGNLGRLFSSVLAKDLILL